MKVKFWSFFMISCLLPFLADAKKNDDDDDDSNGCNISLNIGNQNWQGGGGDIYDPYDPVEYEQVGNFDLTFDSGHACDLTITFSQGDNGNSVNNRRLAQSGSELQFQLYRESGKNHILKDNPSNMNYVIEKSITSSDISPITLSFYWQMNKEQVVEPGTYTDSVELNVYEIGPGNSATMAAGPFSLNLSTVVPPSLYLSIVDSGGSFNDSDTSQTLDFANLEEGESQNFDIMVKGNTGYNVSMTSDNASVLSHSSIGSSSVPYTIKVGGSTKDLSSGTAVVVAGSNDQSGNSGDQYVVEVTIGAIGNAETGTYSDNISVLVSAE